jgi:hypothetical protein
MNVMSHEFSYAKALAASEKVNWRVEDIIGGERRLDFAKPFMPESLARTSSLDFLGAEARLTLNHIRANGYLYTFGLVEEFILPFVLDHTRPMLSHDDVRTRALLRFAMEEAKHIHLFRTFEREFEAGFGMRCEMIGPAEQVASAVLAHHPLSVALLILQVEWMTQRHYLDSIRDNNGLDRQFTSLLRHHWMEEAQHAQLDTLMVESIAAGCTAGEIDKRSMATSRSAPCSTAPSSSRPHSISMPCRSRPACGSVPSNARRSSPCSTRPCAGPISARESAIPTSCAASRRWRRHRLHGWRRSPWTSVRLEAGANGRSTAGRCLQQIRRRHPDGAADRPPDKDEGQGGIAHRPWLPCIPAEC